MATHEKKHQIWGSRLSAAPDAINVEFCAGRDVKSLSMADKELLPYDIWTNLAHAAMLHKIGVLNAEEWKLLFAGLTELDRLSKSGQFELDPAKEDVHINVEHFLTHEKKIPAGSKIHSGRSRNDQVATDIKLFLRDQLIRMSGQVLELIRIILDKADMEAASVMPGFTHYQPAMITTAGHWLSSWTQALLRDVQRFLATLSDINRSPLGAAASFGTSWPIDRELTAELLGFEAVEENSLDCIAARGEAEAAVAADMSLLMNHLGTISQDLILLSTPFYDMVKIDDRYITGSSIMPQKRNPDFAEVIRSKAAYCHGSLMSLLGILKGSMSGYNRDSQQAKYIIMDLFRECLPAPKVLAGVCETMTFHHETMVHHCCTGFMNAADVSDWMAQSFSLPFRTCYEVVSLAVKYSEAEGKLTHSAMIRAVRELELDLSIRAEDIDFLNTPSALIDKKNHTGGPSTESVHTMIDHQQSQWLESGNKLRSIAERIDKARKRCINGQI